MDVGVFVPCYGSSILEFLTEHECLMSWISYCSMSLAKKVPAEKEPIFKGPFAVSLAFFEVPAEGGTMFQQFQTTILGILE
jgi:hypothetical protein